jgi:hypothetical protein
VNDVLTPCWRRWLRRPRRCILAINLLAQLALINADRKLDRQPG